MFKWLDELDGKRLRMTMLTSRYNPYPAYRPSGVEWLGEVPGTLGSEAVEICCHIEPRSLKSTGTAIEIRFPSSHWKRLVKTVA